MCFLWFSFKCVQSPKSWRLSTCLGTVGICKSSCWLGWELQDDCIKGPPEFQPADLQRLKDRLVKSGGPIFSAPGWRWKLEDPSSSFLEPRLSGVCCTYEKRRANSSKKDFPVWYFLAKVPFWEQENFSEVALALCIVCFHFLWPR